MKKHFFLVLCVLSSALLFAQAKKNIGGQDLYQKGSCERVSVKFVSCTYCTDKELKNCKEYWCTDDGTCTEAPKKNQGRSLSTSDGNENVATKLQENDTTSKLPKGTKFVNGKITIQSGYKAVYSSDKTIVFIQLLTGNGAVMGGLTCDCFSGGSCYITYNENTIYCRGDACCGFRTTSKDLSGLTMQKIEQSPEKLSWKRLVVPTKSN